MKFSLPFTSVVSLHTNPLTCGVAKFSVQLAERLNVPFVGFNDEWGIAPLFSLKWSEMAPDDCDKWRDAITYVQDLGSNVSVFWHDDGDEAVTNCSEQVFYADPSLGSPALFCPSLIPQKPRTVRLFTFGMAGRLQIEHFRKVKMLLDAASIRYHLRVSVGIHEGTSLDRVEQHFDALKEVMGAEHVTILGIMTDNAVSDELANTDYVLAFFEHGARANNTTIHAAIEAGADVITNWDASTPLFFNHATKSIDQLRSWPSKARLTSPYTWDNLILQMEDICARSKSTAV